MKSKRTMRRTSTSAASLLAVLTLLGFGSVAAAQTEVIQASASARGVVAADRSLIPGERGRLFFWTTGASSPQVKQGQRVSEAMDELYHSKSLRDLALPERGLAAFQESFGAPSAGHVAAGWLGPTVTIDTSSGEQFRVYFEVPAGTALENLADWLETTALEIAIDTRLTHEGEAAFHFRGALFSDGQRTMLAKLEPCECDAGDIIAWLSTPPKELLAGNGATQTVDRRSSRFSGEWVIETGSRQSAIGYTVSRYSEKQYNSDAVYAVRGDRGGHALYVRTRNECGDETLALQVDSGPTPTYRAGCHRIDEDTLAYTIAGKDVETSLESRLKAGNRFKVGIAQRSGSVERVWYFFSLRGSSVALDALARDAAMLGEAATRSLAERSLPDVIVSSLTSNLQELAMHSPTPAAAHADGDFVARYADGLARQVESGWHPACAQIANSIRMIGSTNNPAQIRRRQVDAMFDKAPSTCL